MNSLITHNTNFHQPHSEGRCFNQAHPHIHKRPEERLRHWPLEAEGYQLSVSFTNKKLSCFIIQNKGDGI